MLYTILTWLDKEEDPNPEETKFLTVLQTIVEQPSFRRNRTGVDTKSIFCPPELRFSLLNNQFPLLTTRKMSLRLIFEELIWFLRGQTDVNILKEKNVHVWDDNSTREFLDNNGFKDYEEGDIGPSYGFQFRYAGNWYVDAKEDYSKRDEDDAGCTIDQLQIAIDLIRNDPTSRRIMINLWNPEYIDQMVLPPCLYGYQFYVDGENNEYLSCKATQRSSDISLAGGWNIATVALFTVMMAHICGMKPKEIIWSVGDAHIYTNQLPGVYEQLARTPRKFPKLYIVKDPENNEITKFEFDHFKLEEYAPHPRIKLSMNA